MSVSPETEIRLQSIMAMLDLAARSGVCAPSNEAISRRAGMSSRGAASVLVGILEERGLITVKRAGCARQITITATGKSTLPVGASPPAPRAVVLVGAEATRRKHRAKANGEATTALSIAPGFDGPRPKLCQWIAGIPTRTDDCKCLAPVMETARDEPARPYCPEHAELARGRAA